MESLNSVSYMIQNTLLPGLDRNPIWKAIKKHYSLSQSQPINSLLFHVELPPNWKLIIDPSNSTNIAILDHHNKYIGFATLLGYTWFDSLRLKHLGILH